MAIHPHIVPAEPRITLRVTLDDGSVLEGPVGTAVGEFLEAAHDMRPYEAPLMGAIVDGQLRELSYSLQRDASIAPVLLNSSDGGRIYRRSLVFLMTTAAAELWPGCRISVRYAVPDGGYYCTRVDGREPFTEADLEQLAERMREIVANDDLIIKRVVPLEEAAALFAERQEDDKVRLL